MSRTLTDAYLAGLLALPSGAMAEAQPPSAGGADMFELVQDCGGFGPAAPDFTPDAIRGIARWAGAGGCMQLAREYLGEDFEVPGR